MISNLVLLIMWN